VGLQIIGRPLEEGTVLKAAYAFEQNNDYFTQRPFLEVK
jgi:aspartyl-tRNA(Asn)/glutamyl-tRNA(Gln) amidotransferase subunit A